MKDAGQYENAADEEKEDCGRKANGIRSHLDHESDQDQHLYDTVEAGQDGSEEKLQEIIKCNILKNVIY